MTKIHPTSSPDMSFCTSMNAAFALLACMKCISMERFGVPWAPHLDRRLWEGEIGDEADASMLLWLSRQSGGWWSWSNTRASGPTFVSISTWRAAMQGEG